MCEVILLAEELNISEMDFYNYYHQLFKITTTNHSNSSHSSECITKLIINTKKIITGVCKSDIYPVQFDDNLVWGLNFIVYIIWRCNYIVKRRQSNAWNLIPNSMILSPARSTTEFISKNVMKVKHNRKSRGNQEMINKNNLESKRRGKIFLSLFTVGWDLLIM